MKDKDGKTDTKGQNPFDTWYVERNGKKEYFSTLYPTYDWVDDAGRDNLGDWIEAAAKKAGASFTFTTCAARANCPPPRYRRGKLMPLREGQPAPDFSMATDNGARVSLSDFKGKNVVLYFFPKASTPG